METLQYINANFSGVLSVAVAIMTALITLVYVIFTYKQMKAAQNANKAAIKQLRLGNQPCIIAEISRTFGSKCFSGTRRQLHIELTSENVGDSPALCVYTFAHLELQHTRNNTNNSNIVNMDYVPDFNKCLKVGAQDKSSVRFETSEINMLVEDLRIGHGKNVQRLVTDPHRTPYRGTVLVVEIYYRNVLGQWFKNTLRREIKWLNDKNAKPRKTNYINENTIPPCPLNSNTEFELHFISPKFSVFSTALVEAKEIEEKLEQYKKYLKY